jgi:putative Ca2+/H+ antiporter (TMEM165/GDT1 family)
MPIETLIVTFVIIMFTEFGDKTMLTSMCFSAQYRRPLIVLAATLLALVIASAIGVLIGVVLSNTLPVDLIVYVSGVLFLVLGVYTIIKSNSEEVSSCENTSTFLGMVSVVLFSELGDKSQIAILALAATSLYPIMVFAGAILGFLVLTIAAVYVGNQIAGFTSMKNVHRVAGLIFIIFGIAVILGIF